jgi:hypothetical protein
MICQGFASTASADRYIQQLVKHWGHRFATTWADGVGEVPFSDTSRATFTACADGVAIRLETADAASAERLQGVIASHLDRFAFREAPLAFTWGEAA